MFGYVTINPTALTPQQKQRYRAFYCGLCHQLGQRHGLLGRLTLSYDLTFLTLLLTALYEPDCAQGTSRCVPHPVKAHPWITSPYTSYAADMGVVLAYYNALDDWQDDGSQAARALAKALESDVAAVRRAYPRQCQAVETALQQLQACEKAGCTNLDEVSGHFGDLMAALLDVYQDQWSAPLQALGRGLGKFIYLMDAYEDAPKDARKGRYNPLLPLCGAADYEAQCRAYLTQAMAQCAEAFAYLPIVQDADLLGNILYVGVWTRYEQLHAKRNPPRQNGADTPTPPAP
jgi:hypothetical protein